MGYIAARTVRQGYSREMLTTFAAGALAFNIIPSFDTLERNLFSANREAEGLVRRLKRAQAGGKDALARLRPSEYVLPTNSAVVITGASDGIGREAAKMLTGFGYPCILAVRDVAKGEAAAESIKDVNPSAKLEVVEMDLSSYASVDAGAAAISEASARLDAPLRGLMLNAGVWPLSRETSADGLELGFATNHVGHMQLAQKLIPSLRNGLSEGDEVRVVSTASSAHAFADVFEPANKVVVPGTSGADFDATTAYGDSKLANVQFTLELAERERRASAAVGKLTALSVHPGVVATSLFREFGSSISPAAEPLKAVLEASPVRPPSQADALNLLGESPLSLVLKTPADGCRTMVYALLAPGLPSGSYLSDCEITDVAPAAKDVAARRKLWEWTEQWLNAQRDLRRKAQDAGPAAGAGDGMEAKLEPEPVVDVEDEIDSPDGQAEEEAN